NDLGNAVSEIEIINSVEQLLEKIEVKFGNIPVAIISVKPSPDRSYLDDKIKNLNGQLLKIMRERARGSFINIYAEMLHPNGAMRPELYEPDGLHINTKGYEIWAKVIKHHLLEQA
ncbi:MAG: GDSL family lipase, partial [Bacteroidota bacterium]